MKAHAAAPPGDELTAAIRDDLDATLRGAAEAQIAYATFDRACTGLGFAPTDQGS